jgi:hypothetical protein
VVLNANSLALLPGSEPGFLTSIESGYMTLLNIICCRFFICPWQLYTGDSIEGAILVRGFNFSYISFTSSFHVVAKAYNAKGEAIFCLMAKKMNILFNQLRDLNQRLDILNQNQQVNIEYVCEDHENDTK